MKKIIMTLVILLMSTVQAKEPKYNIQNKIDISSDRIVNYSQNLSINDDFMFKYDINVEDIFDLETYKISLQDKGYIVEPMATNETAGLIIKKEYPQIDLISKSKKLSLEISKPEEGNLDDKYLFQLKKGLIYDKYIGTYTFDYTKFLDNDDISQDELKKLFNLTFEVNLPSKASKYNATSTNDQLTYLSWNLNPGEKNEVNFEFKVINVGHLAIFVILGFILVVGLIVFIVKKASNKLDEISDQLPKKVKKEKKKKAPKKVYTNGLLTKEEEKEKLEEERQKKIEAQNGMSKDQTKSINFKHKPKVDLMASQDMSGYSNPSQNVQTGQQAHSQKVEITAPKDMITRDDEQNMENINLMAQQQSNNTTSGQTQKVDLMASQDMSAYNKQPQTNNVNSETENYASIFNQYYDDNKKDQ